MGLYVQVDSVDADAVQHEVESFEDTAANHKVATVRTVKTSCGKTIDVVPDRVNESDEEPTTGACPACFGKSKKG